MNLWDRLKFLFSGTIDRIEEKQLPRFMQFQQGQPQFMQDNYRDMADGGYGKNELVFSCIQEIATSTSEAPLRVFGTEEDEVIENHPVRQLMKSPNPFMTEFELWENTIVFLYIAGNAYWEKVRNGAGQVVEIVPLRPDRVMPVPGGDFLEGYDFQIGGQTFRLDPEDIIHFKFPHPLNDFLGMPPLRAGLRATSVDNEATAFAKDLLENKAIPGTVITTQNQVDEATATRLTKKWKQKFGGRNRGEPAFLQEGMEINSVGMNMEELAFPDLRATSETRICSVFGVPPILVGANTGLQRSTFANFEEARRSFWQDTISPLLKRFEDKINHDLLSEFNQNDIEARFDQSNVTALQTIENERWQRVDRAVTNGWLLVNEARTQVGLDPVEGGDIFLRNLSTVGVSADDEGNGNGNGNEQATTPAENNEQRGTDPPETKIKPLRVKKKIVTDQKQIELLIESFGKIEFALEFLEEFESFARNEFREQRREFMRFFNSINKQLDEQQITEILTESQRLERQWETRINDDVFPTMETLINNAMQAGADEVGIAFQLDNTPAIEFVENYIGTFAQTMSRTSQEKITETILRGQRDGLSVAEQAQALDTLFNSWDANRSVMVARSETIRASNKGAQFVYQQAEIEEMEWLASSDACPFCAELDGTVVQTTGSFVGVGDSVNPAFGDARPFTNRYETVEAPPLHPNCRCTIIPVVE